jgi:ABC-type multidrug transport system ATPase subunit
VATGTLSRTDPVRLEGVTARYGFRRRPVFSGISLVLPPGEVTAILGDNGSGKSTLLRIVAGAVLPSGGKIVGRPRRVGYVPDWFPAHPRLSPMTYLVHMGRVAGLPAEVARRRGAEHLERLAFAGDPAAPVDLLSKGNAQKVAIAQALLNEPQLLVLDEPWNGLDLPGQRVMRELVAERVATGTIVVLADHREAFVSGTAQTFRMDEGELRKVEAVPAVPDGGGRTGDKLVVVEVRGLPPERRDDLPGVVSLTVDGDLVRVRVPRRFSDSLLVEVLQRGGSVTRVSPEVRA